MSAPPAPAPPPPARVAHQPLHPDIRARLDPQYVKYHDDALQYIVPSQLVPWSPSLRTSAGPAGGSPLRKVGRTYDLRKEEWGGWEVRVFEPEGDKPEGGWGVLVWYHGGGWVLGNLNSENNFLTHLCSRARIAVVSVNYRHAPEHPYPAAHDDALAALQWVHSPSGSSELGIHPLRIALGGSSAGANLALSASLRAARLPSPVPLVFQLVTIPVCDNTATADAEPWSLAPHAPWLTAARMTWYRDMYFTRPWQAAEWEASPGLAPAEVLAGAPRTWVAISECDLLAEEARRLVARMREAGVEVEAVVYEGSTHSILSLDAILDKGAQLFTDAGNALAKAFGTDS